MLRLKALGFTAVKQVKRGMFAWREAGMPTETDFELVDMPQAMGGDEEALLRRLGYNKDGTPAPDSLGC